MGPLQVQRLRVRVDLGVISMKGYISQSLELLYLGYPFCNCVYAGKSYSPPLTPAGETAPSTGQVRCREEAQIIFTQPLRSGRI